MAMGQHEINREDLPYAPSSLERKADVGADQYFALDIRSGRVVGVEDFPRPGSLHGKSVWTSDPSSASFKAARR